MKLDIKLQEKLGELFAAPLGESELPGALLVDVGKIETTVQPRQYFDEAALKDLENSIRELHEAGKGIAGTGILQPLLVRSCTEEGADGTKKYIVTAGERRLRAAKAVGLQQVPVLVNESNTDEAWEHAIIENLLRADLAPLEEANALQKLMQSRGYSVREAAKRLGKDKGYLENRLFLLKAPEDVQAMVSARADTIRHAREICKITEVAARRKLIESALTGAAFTNIQTRVQKLLEPSKQSNKEKSQNELVEQGSVVSVCADTEILVLLSEVVQRVGQFAENLSEDEVFRQQFVTGLRVQIGELEKLTSRIEGVGQRCA